MPRAARSVRLVAGPEELAEVAAIAFLSRAAMVLAERPRFTVALSGGNSPLATFSRVARLAAGRRGATLRWGDMHFFWVDERCVPPDHPASNYGVAREVLLRHLPLRSVNVHPMVTALAEPAAAAAAYAELLRREFELVRGELPVFDLVLLGLGADGHTASLFPHDHRALASRELVIATAGAALPRITLTLPVLNAAAQLWWLVQGEDRAEAVYRTLKELGPIEEVPARGICLERGEVRWLIDREASARL